jgi:hypothetical protein
MRREDKYTPRPSPEWDKIVKAQRKSKEARKTERDRVRRKTEKAKESTGER